MTDEHALFEHRLAVLAQDSDRCVVKSDGATTARVGPPTVTLLRI